MNSDAHLNYKRSIIGLIDRMDDSDFRVTSRSSEIKHLFKGPSRSVFRETGDFGELEETILEGNQAYLSLCGYKQEDCFISEAWINFGERKSKQILHNHSNSLISGTYYVNFNNNHGGICFEYDRNLSRTGSNGPFLTLQLDDESKSVFLRDSVFQPEEGAILYWQSHMNHYTISSEQGGRVTLSFNLLPKRFAS